MRAKGTTKNLGRRDPHDRFYTTPSEAFNIINTMSTMRAELFDGSCLFVEPSAGEGAFVAACEAFSLPVMAYDIVPATVPICNAKIIERDFLSLEPGEFQQDVEENAPDITKIVFVGNPPFGVQGDLSINFVNQCFELGAAEVWFILPPTFQKESYLSKMPHAEIFQVLELSTSDYILPDKTMRTVPSVFVCFSFVESKPEPIPTAEYLSKLPFAFVKRAHADFAIRRVGGTAGQARIDTSLSEQSNYFCQVNKDSKMSATEIVNKICQLEFPERDWTVGPRSVSQREIAKRWIETYGTD